MSRIESIGASSGLYELSRMLRRDRHAAEPFAVPAASGSGDAANENQRIEHFVSHVGAACFVSLLQMQDPLPIDERDRPEYRRRYRRIHEALEVPPPPGPEPRAIR